MDCIGAVHVKAKPRTEGIHLGYDITYDNGFTTWIPADIFEKHFMKVDSDKRDDSKILVTVDLVDNFIDEINADTIGDKTTAVAAKLNNDFEISSIYAYESKEAYSLPVGKNLCMYDIKNRVRQLLRFLIYAAQNGLNKEGNNNE